MSGCASSRQATSSEVRWKTEEVRSDTLRENVVVTVLDTVKEVTTITVVLRQAQEPTAPDDTVRITTVTDRTRASDRSQLRVKSEKLKVERDTVYVEKQSESSSSVVAGSSTEITPDGTIRPKGVILKWIFWILCAIIVLIIVIRLGLRKVF